MPLGISLIFPSFEADAPAGGDGDGLVVERIVEIGQAVIVAR